MGDEHVKAHSKQHKYLQDDEPEIETITGNKQSDKSDDLALKMGIKQGLKSQQEWEKYNKKLRPARRKKSYDEYVKASYQTLLKNKVRKLKDPELASSKKSAIGQEIAAINQNGMPVDGGLFYISNTISYDKMSPNQLKQYRKFERSTFEKFLSSSTFKELNPGCFRSEIHFDENGAMHAQTQSLWFRKDNRGRVKYAKRASIKDILIKRYGSEKALNDRLDLLSFAHKKAQKAPKDKKRIGSVTPASTYNFLLNKYDISKVDLPGASRAERKTRLVELWRIEQMNKLASIAEQEASNLDVEWKRTFLYTTDGVHRGGPAFKEHKDQLQGLDGEVERLQRQKRQLTDHVKSQKHDLDDLNFDLENTKKTKKKIEKDTKQLVDDNQKMTAENDRLKKQVDHQRRQIEQLKISQKQAEQVAKKALNSKYGDEITELNKNRRQLQRLKQFRLTAQEHGFSDEQELIKREQDLINERDTYKQAAETLQDTTSLFATALSGSKTSIDRPSAKQHKNPVELAKWAKRALKQAEIWFKNKFGFNAFKQSTEQKQASDDFEREQIRQQSQLVDQNNQMKKAITGETVVSHSGDLSLDDMKKLLKQLQAEGAGKGYKAPDYEKARKQSPAYKRAKMAKKKPKQKPKSETDDFATMAGDLFENELNKGFKRLDKQNDGPEL